MLDLWIILYSLFFPFLKSVYWALVREKKTVLGHEI